MLETGGYIALSLHFHFNEEALKKCIIFYIDDAFILNVKQV